MRSRHGLQDVFLARVAEIQIFFPAVVSVTIGNQDECRTSGAGCQAQKNSKWQQVEFGFHRLGWQGIAHRADVWGADLGWRHPPSMGAAEWATFLADLAFLGLAVRERRSSAPPLLDRLTAVYSNRVAVALPQRLAVGFPLASASSIVAL